MKTNILHSFLRILLVLTAGTLVLGQLGRVEVGNGVALYFSDVLLSLVVMTTIALFPKKIFTMGKSRVGNLLIVFASLILLSIFSHFSMGSNGFLFGVLYLLRFEMILLFAASLWILVQQKFIRPLHLLHGFLVSIGLYALLGFFQYAVFPDTRGLVLLGWDDHYYRLISTIFDPGFTGILLVMGVIVSLLQRFKSSSKLYLLYAVVCTIAVLLTYSRASYLALFIGIAWIAWIQRSLATLIWIPLCIAGILLLPRPGGEGVKLERTASITARVESNQQALSSLSPQTFLLGNGWYAKKEQIPTQIKEGVTVPNHSSAPENSYLFVFSSVGIVGLIVWLWIGKELVSISLVASPFTAALLVTSVHALFSNTLFHPFVLIFLGILMVYTTASVRKHSQSQLD